MVIICIAIGLCTINMVVIVMLNDARTDKHAPTHARTQPHYLYAPCSPRQRSGTWK